MVVGREELLVRKGQDRGDRGLLKDIGVEGINRSLAVKGELLLLLLLLLWLIIKILLLLLVLSLLLRVILVLVILVRLGGHICWHMRTGEKVMYSGSL